LAGLAKGERAWFEAALARLDHEVVEAGQAELTVRFADHPAVAGGDGKPRTVHLVALPHGIPLAAPDMERMAAAAKTRHETLLWHAPWALDGSASPFRQRLARAWRAQARPETVLKQALADDTRAHGRAIAERQGLGQGPGPLYAMTKRLLDLAFALGVLILAGWLIVLLWLAVKATSPGPGFFAQVRMGRDEVPFTLYKLRSMRDGTPDMATHQAGQSVVTPVGRFLRATKLDELPQVVNMLRGELSLIGPRPGLPVQAELNMARRTQGVFSVTPGLTGLAQVQGIDMRDPERLALIDQHYVALQSLALDLRIALATLKLARFPTARQ
jgi:lipopolysaccharide/colanic/teichoic acid biosynthesis glycosyltransferase